MARARPGQGVVEASLVDGRTALTRILARNPLRLLCPTRPGSAAWVYTSTYGGGLVAGDETDLEIRAGRGTSCVMSTQASTKVYKSFAGRTCRQLVRASIGEGALLVSAPDPITCFDSARYEQRQRFDVEGGGNLVLVDWLTSGRHERNECWQFSRYKSRIDVRYDGRLIFTDSTLLDPADGPLRSPFRMGRFHCLALLLLVGPLFERVAEQVRGEISRQPTSRRCSFADSASPIPEGLVVRAIGISTEQVAHALQERLSFLRRHLGDTPWSRKW